MKKIGFFAAIVAAASLASCTAQAPKAKLNSELDSLSYMMGITQTQNLEMYLTRQLGLDSTNTASFVKGLEEGFSKTSKNEIAYIAGVQIGQQVSEQMVEGISRQLFGNDSTQSLNKDNFIAGFLAGAKKQKDAPDAASAQAYVKVHADAIKKAALEEKYADNKAAGEKFLAENAKKEGVVTTESGLQYKVIKEGKGEKPTTKNTVKVHYKGTLIDGTEFDSSYSRKEPVKFPVTGVIKGWTEALQLMPVGSKWELYIPQELAYGERQSSEKIKPFSALVFEVELLEIVK